MTNDNNGNGQVEATWVVRQRDVPIASEAKTGQFEQPVLDEAPEVRVEPTHKVSVLDVEFDAVARAATQSGFTRLVYQIPMWVYRVAIIMLIGFVFGGFIWVQFGSNESAVQVEAITPSGISASDLMPAAPDPPEHASVQVATTTTVAEINANDPGVPELVAPGSIASTSSGSKRRKKFRRKPKRSPKGGMASRKPATFKNVSVPAPMCKGKTGSKLKACCNQLKGHVDYPKLYLACKNSPDTFIRPPNGWERKK